VVTEIPSGIPSTPVPSSQISAATSMTTQPQSRQCAPMRSPPTYFGGSCLSLAWAVLDRASGGWRGFTMTPVGLRLLQDLRRSLHNPPTKLLQRNSTKRVETGVAPTDSAAIAENYDP
jgi:hypothetical protein